MSEKPDFHPINDAPLDGRTLLVADDEDGGWIAVAHWTGDMWALGRQEEGLPIEQVAFEPTRFAYPRSAKDPQP